MIVALALWAASPAQAACRDDVVELRGDWGQARFTVELAETDETRARGLMFRERMARMAGMLFVFERPQRAVFWMENTLIALDMLFIGADGVVRQIHSDARPLDRTPIDGGSDVVYVLEINGGLAAQLGISPGAELRHPRIPAEIAAWPCE